MAVRHRLVELRRAHGYSQEELAGRLGVSRQAISKWERAESSPDTDNLIALARLYGISLDGLLLHTPARGAAAQAAPEPEPEAETAPDRDTEAEEVFAAASAWDAAEKAERKARKKELLTLVLMVALPNLTSALGLQEVYALIVTMVYLLTGFLLDNWHPGWMLFLTIPLYYSFLYLR